MTTWWPGPEDASSISSTIGSLGTGLSPSFRGWLQEEKAAGALASGASADDPGAGSPADSADNHNHYSAGKDHSADYYDSRRKARSTSEKIGGNYAQTSSDDDGKETCANASSGSAYTTC